MSERWNDAKLDEIMEQYKQQLLQFQRARRDNANFVQYEQQVTLAPVDYRSMSDQEIFSQPAIPLAQTPEEEAPAVPIIPPLPIQREVSFLLPDAEPDILEELIEEGIEEASEAGAVEEGTAISLIAAQQAELRDEIEPTAAEEFIPEEPSSMPQPPQLLPAALPEPAAWIAPALPMREVELDDLLAQNTAPRLMFAKGCGAFGAFKPYQSFGDICAAPCLQSLSPLGVFARFSSDVLPGDADARRSQRGLLLRIYDGRKSYDFIFTHLPLTLVANPDLMTKLMGAMRPNSIGLRSNAPLWQFVAEHNEALHGMLWLNSDLGTAPSYRTISYYSMPLYLVDKNNERRLCRLRLSPRASANPLTRFEAEELCGCDPDALARDLNLALTQNEGVVFELSAQVIDEQALDDLDFDPLDPTIPWRLSRFPIVTLGEVALSRQVDDYNTQVERMTINFTSPVGVEYPTNSLYAAMSNAAPRAQYYRTGADNASSPTLNIPDPWRRPQNAETPLERVGQWLDQMSQREKKRLIDNLAEELSGLDAELLEQVLLLLTRADLTFGKALTLALEGV